MIFETPVDCCLALMSIIITHGLKPNDEWKRVNLSCLSEDLTSFKNQFLRKDKNYTWNDFKNALKAEYGKNAQELLDEVKDKIMGTVL